MTVFTLGHFKAEKFVLMEPDMKLAEEAIVEKAAQTIEERAKERHRHL